MRLPSSPRGSATDVRPGVALDDRHRLPPGLLPLTSAAACDLVFVLGVLHGPATPEQTWSPWLGIPAIWLALTLPLLLLVTVVVAVTGEPHPSHRSGLHHLQEATIALAVLGLAVYLSPWGRAGVRALLES